MFVHVFNTCSAPGCAPLRLGSRLHPPRFADLPNFLLFSTPATHDPSGAAWAPTACPRLPFVFVQQLMLSGLGWLASRRGQLLGHPSDPCPSFHIGDISFFIVRDFGSSPVDSGGRLTVSSQSRLPCISVHSSALRLRAVRRLRF